MLDIVCYAANPGFPLNLGVHRFTRGADGQLEHWIDGDLRATVPPEGMRDYAQSWPQCAELVGQLLRPGRRAALPGVDAAARELAARL